jgi:hypothetical protein
MDQTGITPQGMSTPTLQNNQNITSTVAITQAAIPAYLVSHEKNAVGIGGAKLGEVLNVYYKAGIRRVEAIVTVGGQPLLADCRINARYSKHRNRTYLWLYPRQPAQSVLRDLYRKYRGEAPRRARRPVPILILAIRPK